MPSVTPDPVVIKQFLEIVYQGKPANNWILIWTLRDKASGWFQDVDSAVTQAFTRSNDTDVYLGVGTADQNLGRSNRANASQITALYGLYADVDFVWEGHKKPNLPPDADAAHALVHELPVPPTIVLHTGHGLQAWWLFDQPLLITDDTRATAAGLVRRWQAKLRSLAHAHGWEVDATFDLARILRIAGTLNWKDPSNKKLVMFMELHPENRHPPEIFNAAVPEEDIEERLFGKPSSDTAPVFALNPDAQPPLDKFHELASSDMKFLKTVNWDRRDLKDQSPSGYDMALALRCVAAGWIDQEIADLITYTRRKHGQPKLRTDYYAMTISKARTTVGLEEHTEMDTDETVRTADTEFKRLSDLFGVNVNKITMFAPHKNGRQEADPQFFLETDSATIPLGDASIILSQTKFRNRLANHQILLPNMSKTTWQACTEIMIKFAQVTDTGPEGSPREIMSGWIKFYIAENNPVEDWEEVIVAPPSNRRPPFLKDGQIHIHAPSLRSWITSKHLDFEYTAKTMGTLLRGIGADGKVISARIDDDHIGSLWVWALPIELFPPS